MSHAIRTLLTSLLTITFALFAPAFAFAATEVEDAATWASYFADSSGAFDFEPWAQSNAPTGSIIPVSSPNDFGEFVMDAAADISGNRLYAYNNGVDAGVFVNSNDATLAPFEAYFEFDTPVMGIGFESYGFETDFEVCGASSDCVTISAIGNDTVDQSWVQLNSAVTVVVVTSLGTSVTEGGAVFLYLYWADNDADGDGVEAIGYSGTDCDDGDDTIFPGAPELCDGIDQDCDGDVTNEVDADSDGFRACAECDDGDPANFPGNPEVCDAQDNNCDVVIDEGFDVDGDGVTTCAGDCDDSDAGTFPGAPESCDAIDSDCDGSLVDEFADFDSDGDPDCTDPDDDNDGDPDTTDCADTDPAIYTDASELCDGLDQNCDGDVTNEVDADSDGFRVCAECDDGDDTVFPGGIEVCNGIDDDCDGVVPADEDNLDGDSYMMCEGDCDDGDNTIFPGATEVCDVIDDDCDGDIVESFADFDGDEIPNCVDDDIDDDGDPNDTDCNDLNASIFTGAPEVCDGVDGNCDGIDDVDDFTNFSDLDGSGTPDCLEVDADGDGFCPLPTGFICSDGTTAGDCDDGDDLVNPATVEVEYDGIDNDCVDGDLVDVDGDGFDSEVVGGNDCDDAEELIYPDATEICDDLDSDCDGSLVDEFADLDLDGDPDCIDEDVDGDGFTEEDGDCDDFDATVHPDAEELPYDGIDNDCDPATVDDDLDGDGYDEDEDCDDSNAALNLDDEDEDGYHTCGNAGVDVDCDDGDPDAYPGNPELCDGIDNDCDGEIPADEFDADADGWFVCDGDCNDDDPDAYPGAEEIADDDIDQDCDGEDTTSPITLVGDPDAAATCSQGTAPQSSGLGMGIGFLGVILFVRRRRR